MIIEVVAILSIVWAFIAIFSIESSLRESLREMANVSFNLNNTLQSLREDTREVSRSLRIIESKIDLIEKYKQMERDR